MSKQFIVKCQLSLMTSESTQQVMVYNEDRTVLLQVDCTPDLKAMFGDSVKIFRYAHIRKDKMLSIDDPAPWQEW